MEVLSLMSNKRTNVLTAQGWGRDNNTAQLLRASGFIYEGQENLEDWHVRILERTYDLQRWLVPDSAIFSEYKMTLIYVYPTDDYGVVKYPPDEVFKELDDLDDIYHTLSYEEKGDALIISIELTEEGYVHYMTSVDSVFVCCGDIEQIKKTVEILKEFIEDYKEELEITHIALYGGDGIRLEMKTKYLRSDVLNYLKEDLGLEYIEWEMRSEGEYIHIDVKIL